MYRDWVRREGGGDHYSPGSGLRSKKEGDLKESSIEEKGDGSLWTRRWYGGDGCGLLLNGIGESTYSSPTSVVTSQLNSPSTMFKLTIWLIFSCLNPSFFLKAFFSASFNLGKATSSIASAIYSRVKSSASILTGWSWSSGSCRFSSGWRRFSSGSCRFSSGWWRF